MKNLRIFGLNLLWLIICSKEMLFYYLSCFNVRRVQRNILLQTIKHNHNSGFGKQFNFSKLKTIEDFQRTVPIQGYDEYHLWIDKLKKGEFNAVTDDAPMILEPTSGSSGISKLIPYTRNLSKQFLRGIRPWIFSLLCSDKRMLKGMAYWSITPFLRYESLHKGFIPIGFKDDGEYFSSIERRILGNILVVPGEISEISDLENFRYVTLLFLVLNQNLSFISNGTS